MSEEKRTLMPSALDMVEEFHNAFNCPVLKTPTIPDVPSGYAFAIGEIEDIKTIFKRSNDRSRSFLRIKLVFEEFTELAEAISTHNLVEILDALCDLLYVVYGTAHEYGLGPILKEAFREVHRSNMSKLNGDGAPIIRNDGKVLKGPNFTPPDLSAIINKFNSLASIHPEWNTEQLRDACNKAIKEGYQGQYEKADLSNISDKLSEIAKRSGQAEREAYNKLKDAVKDWPDTSNAGSVFNPITGQLHKYPMQDVDPINRPDTPVIKAAEIKPLSPVHQAAIEFKNTQISVDDIELVLTCPRMPEQYDAFYQGKQVGYLRLRHGYFRVDYPDCGSLVIYEAFTKGDGEFDDNERDLHLLAAKNAIIERIKKDPSGPYAMGPSM